MQSFRWTGPQTVPVASRSELGPGPSVYRANNQQLVLNFRLMFVRVHEIIATGNKRDVKMSFSPRFSPET